MICSISLPGAGLATSLYLSPTTPALDDTSIVEYDLIPV